MHISLLYLVLINAPFVREVWERVRLSGLDVVSLVAMVEFFGVQVFVFVRLRCVWGGSLWNNEWFTDVEAATV